MEFCPRCAWNLDRTDLPCASCWDGKPSRAEFERVVAVSCDTDSFGVKVAARLLADIISPAFADDLCALISDSEQEVRAAALRSLGWCGSGEHVGATSAALDDESGSVRSEARTTLAELGGPDAADALAAHLGTVSDGEEQRETLAALAWLNDERSLPRARELAARDVTDPQRNHARGTVWTLFRTGTLDDALELARIVGAHRPEVDPNNRWRVLGSTVTRFSRTLPIRGLSGLRAFEKSWSRMTRPIQGCWLQWTRAWRLPIQSPPRSPTAWHAARSPD